MFYYWLDPLLEGKADETFEWVMGAVFLAAFLTYSPDTHAPTSQTSQVVLSEPGQGTSAVGPYDPSCRTEMVKGLAVTNCE